MTATGLVCSSCGIELPQNAKFCLERGARVTGSGGAAMLAAPRLSCRPHLLRHRGPATPTSPRRWGLSDDPQTAAHQLALIRGGAQSGSFRVTRTA
jgi:hypothetical protein